MKAKPIVVLVVVAVVAVLLAVVLTPKEPGDGDGAALRIIDFQYGNSDRARSLDVANGMILANAKLDGFFGSNEPGAFGILRALKQNNLAGKIKFVGFDASEDLVKGLRDGYIDALVVQDPFNIGYQAVRVMVDHLGGKQVPKTYHTALRLITPQNIDTDEIRDLLNPPLDKYLSAPAVQDPKLKLAVVPKGTAHVFWQTVHAGAIAAAQEFKVEIAWKGTEDESQHAKQTDIIEGFMTTGVQGIVLAPTQADSQVPVIEKAVAKGIPVVIFDSGANTDKYVSFVATDNYKGGVMAAEKLHELLGGKGRIAVVATMPGGASTTQRENGFLETMANKYKAVDAAKHVKK